MQIDGPGKDLDDSIWALQEDYNQCVKMIRKIYNYLEQVGIAEFNKYSKFKWSLDREKGFSYVCVRCGGSLKKKSLIKSSAHLEDAELFKWVENKNLICEALDEACEYIRDRVRMLKRKMEETKTSIMEYEEKLNDLDKEVEETDTEPENANGYKMMRHVE